VELVLFCVLTAAAIWSREAPLLREAMGYLVRRRETADAVPSAL
jgi:hypothetical protein